MRSPDAALDQAEYERLENFRFQIRKFLHFSEAAARSHGLEPQQHQALLALKAMPDSPSIGNLAKRLLLKHHSAVGLVDRLELLELVSRQESLEDARRILVRLTAKGEDLLHRLSVDHRAELEEAGPSLAAALKKITRQEIGTTIDPHR